MLLELWLLSAEYWTKSFSITLRVTSRNEREYMEITRACKRRKDRRKENQLVVVVVWW